MGLSPVTLPQFLQLDRHHIVFHVSLSVNQTCHSHMGMNWNYIEDVRVLIKTNILIFASLGSGMDPGIVVQKNDIDHEYLDY